MLERGEGLHVPAGGVFEVGLEGPELVGRLEKADAACAGGVEQRGGGDDHVGMDVVAAAGGHTEHALAPSPVRFTFTATVLPLDELREAADLVGHRLKLPEQHGGVIGAAPRDGDGGGRRGGDCGRPAEHRGYERGRERAARDPEEVAAASTGMCHGEGLTEVARRGTTRNGPCLCPYLTSSAPKFQC